jgi:diacylglycerol O-acyltransferase / wax synthase
VRHLRRPRPDFDEILALIAGKLPQIPRYRQKVRFVPGDIGLPVWVGDGTFDFAHHVRHTALPEPASVADLDTVIGRVMSQELDRSRPLWEAWMIDGRPEDRWALVSKVHHCVVAAWRAPT